MEEMVELAGVVGKEMVELEELKRYRIEFGIAW
jgi:hypothetical protein